MTRIVKMIFKPEKVTEFLELFENTKNKILNFEGCNGLTLYQNIHEHHIIFTYSLWDSELHLNKYRESELFFKTWENTKSLFNGKPEAWSIEEISYSRI
jgi:heme oxygenase (mycobilin-producing)